MIVLFGGGAFAVEVATYLMDMAAAGSLGEGEAVTDVVDPNPSRIDDLRHIVGSSLNVVASVQEVSGLSYKRGIICVGDPMLRWSIQRDAAPLCGSWASVIHPASYVAPTATVGAGAIVSPFAFVGPFARVGENAALNVSAMVGHDAVIESCAVMSPHSVINGFAYVGNAAFLGSNAAILPKVRLGAFSKLAAGAVLRTSTGNGFLLEGNPAKGRQMFRLPADVPA